jgi:hypothetical protein
MYDEIPAAFRVGISGVTAERDAKGHPTLPNIWTLGECVTEYWPDSLGGLGYARSEIVLYHGSFERLAADDAGLEWKAELWETMLHELLHHREAAADEDGLDLFDWAADQNFRRLAGLDFDPFFHRVVPADLDGAVRLEGETFVDVRLESRTTEATFVWRGGSPGSESGRWPSVGDRRAPSILVAPGRGTTPARALGAGPPGSARCGRLTRPTGGSRC